MKVGKLYVDLMSYWRELFPGRIYDVNYERLTVNQEEEIHKLLDYCELEWQQGCIDFYKTKRFVKTASATQVREKMYKGSSNDWKKYEDYIQPLICSLND